MRHLKIYMDIDDCILNTAEVFINHYCKEHNINKNFYDLKDWEFKSIDKNMNIQDFIDFLYSDDFWNNVKLNSDFKKRYSEFFKKIVFLTNKATLPTPKIDSNYYLYYNMLDFKDYETLKKEYIEKELNDEIFVLSTKDKTLIDLSDGIQVDDNINNLRSNARYKILVKKFHDTNYNTIQFLKEDIDTENLYIVNDMKEALEVIEWIYMIEKN